MDQTEEYQHGLYSGKLEKQWLDFFQVLASQLVCRRDLPYLFRCYEAKVLSTSETFSLPISSLKLLISKHKQNHLKKTRSFRNFEFEFEFILQLKILGVLSIDSAIMGTLKTTRKSWSSFNLTFYARPSYIASILFPHVNFKRVRI